MEEIMTCYDLVNEDEVKSKGTAQGYCPTCCAVTDYTHNSYGEVFCTSCGQTPDGKTIDAE